MRKVQMLYVCFIVMMLASCHVNKHMAEQASSVDSVSVSVTNTTEQASTSVVSIREADSTTLFVYTVTTEYDTSKADSNGVAPVLKKVEAYISRMTGHKKEKDCQDNIKISATKEESANQVNIKNNKREYSKAESKQQLYWSYVLYGVALVVLMAILAYWVFTKYRATRSKTN